MTFLLDHDVPAEVGRVLKQAGHDISEVMNLLSRTASDAEVFDCATTGKLIVITCNRDDFIELSRGRMHSGLIVLIRRRSRIAECAALLRLLERAGAEGIRGNVNFA